MTVQELYTQMGGSYESAKRILPMDKLIIRFILKFPDDKSYTKLHDAGLTKDPVGLFEGAHALKGVCANLGLMSLSAQASDIAEEFRPGNERKMDDAELERRLAKLDQDYETTVTAIRAFAAEQ